MNHAILRKVSTLAILLPLAAATSHGLASSDPNQPKMAVLHATVTITGSLTFTGSFDNRLPVQFCADVAKRGAAFSGPATFNVPIPPDSPGGNPGSVGSGHTFSTDAAASPYHGPGTYTGSALAATQLDADTVPGDQETHIFAFPTEIGTLIVNPDASGSFQFSGLQDAASNKISGLVTWTCSQQ